MTSFSDADPRIEEMIEAPVSRRTPQETLRCFSAPQMFEIISGRTNFLREKMNHGKDGRHGKELCCFRVFRFFRGCSKRSKDGNREIHGSIPFLRLVAALGRAAISACSCPTLLLLKLPSVVSEVLLTGQMRTTKHTNDTNKGGAEFIRAIRVIRGYPVSSARRFEARAGEVE